MDYKLISIAIVFLVFLIIFVKQELTFRKYFGRSTKLDELLQNTERTRMEELHSSIEAEREKLSATITEETTQLYKDLQQKRTELEDSYQSKRDEINQYTRDMIDSSNQDIEMHKLILQGGLQPQRLEILRMVEATTLTTQASLNMSLSNMQVKN